MCFITRKNKSVLPDFYLLKLIGTNPDRQRHSSALRSYDVAS